MGGRAFRKSVVGVLGVEGRVLPEYIIKFSRMDMTLETTTRLIA